MRAVVLALLVAASAGAQPRSGPADLLQAMEDAVGRLDYETAEARAREALGRFDALSPDQLVTVHTTLGVLLYARNQPVEARRQFEAALSLDPGLTLDPVLVSPKTVEFFDEVRATAGPDSGTAGAPAIRYVVLPDPRPTAALRSLVLPGWGQFTKGDRAKGWAFAVAAGAVTAGAVAAHVVYLDAHREYNLPVPRTEEEFNALNDRQQLWLDVRNGLLNGAAVVWGAAALEALVTGGPAVERLAVEPASEGVGLSLRVGL
ncbi:hypothetical protein [Rubrivirga sp.]|uniref:tetratricopeptide repeat protein n=1 Tax=Rubrivirga sp. TaxID=1885344 RepID=UPI003B51D41B